MNRYQKREAWRPRRKSYRTVIAEHALAKAQAKIASKAALYLSVPCAYSGSLMISDGGGPNGATLYVNGKEIGHVSSMNVDEVYDGVTAHDDGASASVPLTQIWTGNGSNFSMDGVTINQVRKAMGYPPLEVDGSQIFDLDKYNEIRKQMGYLPIDKDHQLIKPAPEPPSDEHEEMARILRARQAW